MKHAISLHREKSNSQFFKSLLDSLASFSTASRVGDLHSISLHLLCTPLIDKGITGALRLELSGVARNFVRLVSNKS